MNGAIAGMHALNNALVFTVWNPSDADVDKGEATSLWKSDGTPAGTVDIADVPDIQFLSAMAVLNGALYFTTHIPGPPEVDAVWRTDGTTAGTTQVLQWPGAFDIGGITAWNGEVYFSVNDDNPSISSFFVSDGTAAGTTKLLTSSRQVNVADLVPTSSTLLFSVVNSNANDGLWQTDGTVAGTSEIKYIPTSQFDLEHSAVLGNTVYFNYDDGQHGQELWKTDGSAAGTVMVADLAPGTSSSEPESMTAVGTHVFFTGRDGSNIWHLWETDGTAAGTSIVAVPVAPQSFDQFFSLTAFDDLVVFATFTPPGVLGSNLQLWASDGTAAGMFAMPSPTAVQSQPASPALCDDTLYYETDQGLLRIAPGSRQPVSATEVTVSADHTDAGPADPIVVTATVSSSLPAAGPASGSVQFVVDGVPLGPALVLVGGRAQTTLAGLQVGSHALSATYLPDNPLFTSNAASPLTLTVHPSPDTSSPASTPDTPNPVSTNAVKEPPLVLVAPPRVLARTGVAALRLKLAASDAAGTVKVNVTTVRGKLEVGHSKLPRIRIVGAGSRSLTLVGPMTAIAALLENQRLLLGPYHGTTRVTVTAWRGTHSAQVQITVQS
jgi:ELWxxDGT repeat protein